MRQTVKTCHSSLLRYSELLLAGLIDSEDTRIVLHGTDGTDRLGTEWLFYGDVLDGDVSSMEALKCESGRGWRNQFA